MARRDTLSPRQVRAIAALLTESSIEAAAKKADVSRRQLYRWMEDDGRFADALKRAQAEVLDAAKRRLISLHEQAVDAIVGLLASDAPWVKLQAAQLIFASAAKMVEQGEFRDRILALEQQTASSAKERA